MSFNITQNLEHQGKLTEVTEDQNIRESNQTFHKFSLKSPESINSSNIDLVGDKIVTP